MQTNNITDKLTEHSDSKNIFGKKFISKLLLIIFFVSLFTLFVGLIGANALSRSWQASHSFATKDVPIISDLYTLEEISAYEESLIKEAQSSMNDSNKLKQLQDKFNEYVAASEKTYNFLQLTDLDQSEQNLLKSAYEQNSIFIKSASLFFSKPDENNSELNTGLKSLKNSRQNLFDLSHSAKKQIAENATSLSDFYSTLRRNLFVLSILGLAIASIVGVVFSRKVLVNPVLSVEQNRDELAKLNTELNEKNRLLVEREIELNNINKRMKDIDANRSEFVSIVAHQLRTPLAGVKWTLDMLINGDMGQLTPEQKGFLIKIVESNDRMIRFVTDLLSISRIETGRLEYNFSPVNLEQIAESVLLDIYPIANKKDVFVNLRSKGISLPLVAADTEKIRAVFQNLLENSVKYSKSGGHVTLDIRNKGQEVVVSVSDEGMGIPKNEQSELFKRFYRAPSTTKVQAEGSGLGLYLAKSIVEGHNGKIWFESTPGKGSTFYFSLPVPRNIDTKNV